MYNIFMQMKGSPGTGGCQTAFRALIDLVDHRQFKGLLQALFVFLFQDLRDRDYHAGMNVQRSPVSFFRQQKQHRGLTCQDLRLEQGQAFCVFLHAAIDVKKVEADISGAYGLV